MSLREKNIPKMVTQSYNWYTLTIRNSGHGQDLTMDPSVHQTSI